MYNDDITRKYILYKGCTPTRGKRMDLSPIMHFFLMDCVRDMYSHFNRPLEPTDQKLRSKWKAAMIEFTYRFWVPFKAERTREMEDYIIDKLDSYRAWIQKDLEIARYSWEAGSMELPVEEQHQFSALWLANYLAACAQGAHTYTFKHRTGIRTSCKYVPLVGTSHQMLDREIDCVLKSTQDLCLSLYPDGTLTERQYQRIKAAGDAIVNRTRMWLEKDANAEQERVNGDRTLNSEELADARRQLMARFSTR